MVVDKVKDINQVSGGSALINILKKHEAVTSFVYIIDKKRYGIDLKHYASLIDSVINKNPDLDVQDSQDKNTALMLAIINGQEDVARKILDKNPNLDLQNSDGNTALMLCFIHRRFDLAKTILEKKPDVRPVNDKKESALLLALKYQKQDMAVEILERGADPRVNSNEGDALHFANSEVMRRRLRGKIIEFEKAETPPNPDMIVLTTKVDTVITLTEIFNFKKMECTSFIQKEKRIAGRAQPRDF
jgi:ankyrin repeat protein